MVSRRNVLEGIAVGAGLTAVGGIAPAMAAHHEPTVAGPITGGRRGHPFTAYLGDICDIGYIEEEYFLEGEATRYLPVGETTFDGKWTMEPTTSSPYKTRMLIRRPADPARFNGVVILEWLNVTAGYDTSTIGQLSNALYEEGFALAFVTCQQVGVHGTQVNPQALRAWDPERYGSLSIPGDGLSYDILSQAGRMLGPDRPRGGIDPWDGLDVRKIIATGASQSAGRLLTYINALHLRDRVFDGYHPTIGFGMGFGFGDGVLDPSAGMPDPTRVFIPCRFRDDLDVPVFAVNSETESLLYYRSRQPDSDMFRYWEVAGGSHVPQAFDAYLLELRERDGLVGDDTEFGSRVMWEPSSDAALQHMVPWMMRGAVPPTADLIDVEMVDGRPQVVRDEYGNALGGVRLPEVDVPTATYTAAIVALNATMGLRGTTEPFSAERLRELYPTREDYVAKVTEAAHAAEAGGYIDHYQVAAYISQAQREPLGA